MEYITLCERQGSSPMAGYDFISSDRGTGGICQLRIGRSACQDPPEIALEVKFLDTQPTKIVHIHPGDVGAMNVADTLNNQQATADVIRLASQSLDA